MFAKWDAPSGGGDHYGGGGDGGGSTPATTDLSAYADAGAVSEWARDALAWANATGLIAGRAANTLAPGESATRAEVAAVLHRFVEAAE